MKNFILDFIYIIINYLISYIPSWYIRKVCYQLLGMKIGKGSRICMGTVVIKPWKIRIGKNSIINEKCHLDARGMFIENKFDINPLVFYIRGITGTLCVLYLSKAIVKLPFVSYIGRYSIMILLTHLLVLAVVSMVVSKLICNSDLAYWTTVCVTLISYIVIIPLMKKYLPYVTSQKDVFNL